MSKTWNERITNAERPEGRFTAEDRELICQWPTCAVGEKCDLDSGPLSTKTYLLGVLMMDAVRSDHVAQARRLYNKIQAVKCS